MEQQLHLDQLAGYLTRTDALLQLTKQQATSLSPETQAALAALEAERAAWPEWDIGSMTCNTGAQKQLPWALPATVEVSAPTDKPFLVSEVDFGNAPVNVDVRAPGQLKAFATGSGVISCWCVLPPGEKLTLRITPQVPGAQLTSLPVVKGYPLGRAE